jgi:hypothetical protein
MGRRSRPAAHRAMQTQRWMAERSTPRTEYLPMLDLLKGWLKGFRFHTPSRRRARDGPARRGRSGSDKLRLGRSLNGRLTRHAAAVGRDRLPAVRHAQDRRKAAPTNRWTAVAAVAAARPTWSACGCRSPAVPVVRGARRGDDWAGGSGRPPSAAPGARRQPRARESGRAAPGGGKCWPRGGGRSRLGAVRGRGARQRP